MLAEEGLAYGSLVLVLEVEHHLITVMNLATGTQVVRHFVFWVDFEEVVA